MGHKDKQVHKNSNLSIKYETTKFLKQLFYMLCVSVELLNQKHVCFQDVNLTF